MNNIKMLALDLDGTLTNSQKQVTPGTRAALKAAMAQGVQIVLASGRPPVGIASLADELALAQHGGCILAYNGGQIVDCRTGETLYQKRFPPEMIAPVCAMAAAHAVGVLSYDDGGVVTEHPDDPWVKREAEINKIPIHPVKSLPEYLTYPICKLLLTLDPAKMPALEADAHSRFAGSIDTVRSCDFFLECLPKGVGKDAGLAALAAREGIAQSEVMACGDAMNDASMIRWAGVGVCMQNGDPEVKKLADYVTKGDNDHDGVAEAIERFILG
ncbi:MAG: Cof-type HAD-IIB family hydrolase [Faecalibacterium sp.]|jgi:Cof subfamily protein (haloacid dehalogenase superfamily)|nr:Cof-type HAD-IIB family hydrolase [Faecalibacterium sp.]